jgi:hypothetical protein
MLFGSYLYHCIVQVPLKLYNLVYRRIYFDIPYLVQVVGIPDVHTMSLYICGDYFLKSYTMLKTAVVYDK